MKKILALALCVALCLCLSLPAFAAETAEGDYQGESQGQDVNITIGGEGVHVYLVDIEFSTVTFSYSSDAFRWNPENYQYQHDEGGAWSGEGTVKIVNHSDLSVNYKVEATDVVPTYGPLTINLAGTTTGTIEACTPETVKGSKKAEVTYTVVGTPTVTKIVEAVKLGKIKVTISK